MTTSNFRRLDPTHVVATIARLRDRIRERFPTANLGNVADDLLVVAKDHARRSEAIRRSILPLRLLSVLLIATALTCLIGTIVLVHPSLGDNWQWTDVIQTLEAALGALFFLSAGMVYVASLEARAKRRRCLDAIHEMRAMAHIVDMHQLTKDPERVQENSKTAEDTSSSPKRTLTRYALARYLDYCSEMLSLMGKVAAMYVQDFADERAVAAVDEVEDLTTGLSRKIWQKIMILDSRAEGGPDR